jgi:hypothetical protein
MLKGIRKKYDDMRQASRDKKKEKEDSNSGSGGAAISDEFDPMPPPAKYVGPVPRGMEQEPELSTWVSANGFDTYIRSKPSYTLYRSLVLTQLTSFEPIEQIP